MRCYALATRFGEGELTWSSPATSFNSLGIFIKLNTANLKQELLAFAEKMEEGGCHFLETKGYFLYAQKRGTNLFAIALDCKLDEKQCYFLYNYIISHRVDPSLVAADPVKYTQDYKIAETQAQLAEVKKVMIENIDKIIQRGERLEELLNDTEELEQSTKIFKHTTEELNSCWPSMCAIL